MSSPDRVVSAGCSGERTVESGGPVAVWAPVLDAVTESGGVESEGAETIVESEGAPVSEGVSDAEESEEAESGTARCCSR